MFNKDEILKARKEYLEQKVIDDIEEKKKQDIEALRVVTEIVDAITAKVSTETGKQELIKNASCCVDLREDLAYALHNRRVAEAVNNRISEFGLKLEDTSYCEDCYGEHYCYVYLKEDKPVNNKTKKTKEYSFFRDFFSGLFGVK